MQHVAVVRRKKKRKRKTLVKLMLILVFKFENISCFSGEGDKKFSLSVSDTPSKSIGWTRRRMIIKLIARFIFSWMGLSLQQNSLREQSLHRLNSRLITVSLSIGGFYDLDGSSLGVNQYHLGNCQLQRGEKCRLFSKRNVRKRAQGQELPSCVWLCVAPCVLSDACKVRSRRKSRAVMPLYWF